MTPKQIEVTAPEWREACASATLPKWKIKMTETTKAYYGASNAGSSTAFDTLTLAAGASYAVAQETIRILLLNTIGAATTAALCLRRHLDL
jgi:hypothetical protein